MTSADTVDVDNSLDDVAAKGTRESRGCRFSPMRVSIATRSRPHLLQTHTIMRGVVVLTLVLWLACGLTSGSTSGSTSYGSVDMSVSEFVCEFVGVVCG